MDRVDYDTARYYAEQERAGQEYEDALDEMGYYDEERDYAEMVIEEDFLGEWDSYKRVVYNKGINPIAYWFIWKYAGNYKDDTPIAAEEKETAFEGLFYLIEANWDLDEGIFNDQQKMAIMFAYIHEQKEFNTTLDYVDTLNELERMRKIETRK